MERALDPQLIGLALGPHERLPSPEEISNLLAEAELALLLHRPEMSDALIGIGWYLHAVASSKYALRTYGIERQRAAFQVAGHIFDLVLQSQESDRVDQLKYGFAAQIAYLRSQLDPNALALYQRRFATDLGDLGLLTHHQEVALSCGVAFLGMDVGYIYHITRILRDEVDRLAAEWAVDDIFATPFGSAAGAALGTRDLMSFLIYGDNETLNRARELLRTAVLIEPGLEDQNSRWVAAHLLNVADDLERISVWTALPPDVPSGVRRAFTVGSPKILTLWPPQLELLKLGEQAGANPLSPEVKRLFLSTPTSGGKTLLAQLLVTSHLATEQSSVCYVAPTRSLCREVRRSLESRLRFVGARIADGLPEGSWAADLLDSEPQVEVMTPERLSYLIRSNGSELLDKFGLFIFDEVHTIGDQDRGWTLEEDLTYLHYMTRRGNHRIVLMSAAVGNRFHFVEWMGDETVDVHSGWRGPRRLHAIWRTEADWDQSTIEEVSRARKYPRRQSCPLYGRLDIRISHTGQHRELRTTEPVGSLVLKISAEGDRHKDSRNSTAFYRTIIPLIQHLSESGPVLVIESTRHSTVRMAKAIADEEELTDQPRIQSLVDLVEARLGTNHPLWQVLRQGVAYHHGSLPSEIRMEIEEAVTRGDLRFLVATTTMTEGVNLPVKSVVVASQGSYSDEGYLEYIAGSKLINAIGRAGRATKETEGVVVLARAAAPDPADFDRLSPADPDIEVISTLATKQALEALADFEEFQRTAEDAVIEAGVGAVSDFLAFVWFAAAELERLGTLPSQENIRDVLERTLAWVQLSPEDRNRWLSVVELVLARYNETGPPARRRWAAAGTSLSSASEMEGISQELADVLIDVDVPEDPVEVVNLMIGDGRLQRILQLPEAPDRRVYTQRSGANREKVEIPIDALLLQWLQGGSLLDLADSYFDSVADVDFRFEQLGDFINDYFEIYLPWVFGTIVAWTNDSLQEGGADVSLPRTVPAYVRWGVAHPTALELMARGVQSRRLALRIAEQWEAERQDRDVHSWLRSMDVAEWTSRFQASVAELRNLLEFCRSQRRSVAAELITEGVAELEVESHFDNYHESDASLRPIEDTELSPIGIWVGEELVARIPSKDQSDVLSLLGTGLTLSAKFSAWFGEGFLELQLVDPRA